MKLFTGKYSAVAITILAWLLVNCSEDADPETKTTTKASILWAEGFPKVRPGARTLDFDLQPSVQTDIHYILSTEPLSLTRDELIAAATTASNEAIVKSGTLSIAAGEHKKETITDLKEKSDYYAYIIASDTSVGKKDEWLISQAVATKVRHDTSTFYAPSETRTSYYLLYSPEEVLKYPEEKYPIIYYTAGDGERSLPNRTINVMRNGTLTQYINRGNDVPMMVFTIQHIYEVWNAELIGDAIAYAKENLPVDLNRQYLVGTSAGAFACWDYGLMHPNEFAAIVPISGGGKNDLACNAKNLAVWAFHNQPDNKVGPSRSITMINDILDCAPQKEVKLTLFNDLGHNCWRRVFDPNHPDWETLSPGMEKIYLYEWLLQFSRDQN